jgi:hypothetical protein
MSTQASLLEAPKETQRGEISTAPVFSRDRFHTEPRKNDFVTDKNYFFGFKRRTPGQRTPPAELIADYVYDPVYDRHMRGFVCGENLMLIGPPGSGKTQLGIYLAHHMGLAFYPLAMYAHTQGEDLLGKPAQNDEGLWRFVPAPLVQAYEHGGLVLLDEFPALKPGVAMLLHPFLNRDPVIIQTDTGERTIYPHDDFRAIATGNHWSRFAGNYEIGEALGDRMTFVHASFLPAESEISLLCDIAPNVQPGVITDLVSFAQTVRAGVEASPDTNRYCPSTRVLRKLVSKMEITGHTLDEAVEDCIIQKLRELYRDEYKAVLKVLKGHVALENWDKYAAEVAD